MGPQKARVIWSATPHQAILCWLCWSVPKAYPDRAWAAQILEGIPIEGKYSIVLNGDPNRAKSPLSKMLMQSEAEHILHRTIFLLILPGDCHATYRFNEAVCSGGVPVLANPF